MLVSFIIAPIFQDKQEALLASPAPLPKAALRRCKTLTGIRIGGPGWPKADSSVVAVGSCTPAARKAEELVARSLGIVRDGEDVTEATLQAVAANFAKSYRLK